MGGGTPALARAVFPAPGEHCTAASVWRIATAHLAERLVGPQERVAIELGLATLPPLSALILERPLAVRAPQVDISLCATPADGGPRCWPDHPAWARLRDFYRAWSQEGVLRRAIPSIWLEFDRPQLAFAAPAPCFFANTRRLAAADRDAVFTTILGFFADPATRAQAGQRIDAILGRLPAGASLGFLGVMLSRAPASIRLCIDMPSQLLPDCLALAGHRPDARLRTLAGMAAQHADTVVLHLDALDTAAGKVGVELKPRRSGGWPALLAGLERHGLCSGNERDDLLAASRRSGISRHAGKPLARSGFSVRAPAMWANVDTFVFETQVNHVKLVYCKDDGLAAKAYLQVGYKWKNRDGAGQ